MGWDVSEATKKYSGGLLHFFSSPKQILARGGELFVLLAGRPADQNYPNALSELEEELVVAGRKFSFDGIRGTNRRGPYSAISTGVTHGGGSKVSTVQLNIRRCQLSLS